MARVNLEERLFADDRLTKVGRAFLVAESGLAAKAMAIGMLAILWRISQEEGKEEATREEIAYWLDLADDEDVLDAILEQLTKANYLSASSNAFRISGNADQLAAQQMWKDRASKGGKAKRKKELAAGKVVESQNKDGVLKASLKQALSTESSKLEASLKHAIQYNSIQLDSIGFDSIEFDSKRSEEELINSLTDHSHDPFSDGINPSGPEKKLPAVSENSQKPKKSKSAGEASHGSQVWEAYSIAYEQRMRVKPIRNAKQNALCAQLVQRLGVENAVKCAVFYLSHPGQFYMQQKYPLGLLVKDCEGIYTEFQRGEYVTAEKAKRASVSQENHQALERYLASQEN